MNSVIRTILPTAFTLLYLLAMVRPVFPLFDYVINQDYISAFLCINKDRPELECNGKCYLMQKLAAEKQTKKEGIPAIDLREYPIGFVFLFSLSPRVPVTSKNGHCFQYSNDYNFLLHGNHFHPPNTSLS